MTNAGGRHPLQVMAVLHSHYGRLLRLDGSGRADEVSAGEVLGVKGFGARKALERAQAMGPQAMHEAIQLLAQADLDLRGRRELPEDAVLEVLVARLCRLSGPAGGGVRPALSRPRGGSGLGRRPSSSGSCAGRPGSCG